MKYIFVGLLLCCFVFTSLADRRIGDSIRFADDDTTENPTTEKETTRSEETTTREATTQETSTTKETTSEQTTEKTETTEKETTAQTTIHDVTTHEQNTTNITTTAHHSTVTKSDKYVKEGTFVAVTAVLSVIIVALGIALFIIYIKCRQRTPYGSLK